MSQKWLPWMTLMLIKEKIMQRDRSYHCLCSRLRSVWLEKHHTWSCDHQLSASISLTFSYHLTVSSNLYMIIIKSYKNNSPQKFSNRKPTSLISLLSQNKVSKSKDYITTFWHGLRGVIWGGAMPPNDLTRWLSTQPHNFCQTPQRHARSSTWSDS